MSAERQSWWAPWALPITDKPVQNALVTFEDGKVTSIRGRISPDSFPSDAGTVTRFDDCIIAPGFVNAHAHIEYAMYDSLVDGLTFEQWIGDHIQRKRRLTVDHMLASARVGALACARSGITFVADASYSGAAATALAETGLRGRVYLEVFSGPNNAPEIVESALSRLEVIRESTADALVDFGLSPHAPYTADNALFSEVHETGLPWTSHFLESSAERMYIDHDSGPLLDPLGLGRRTAGHWPTGGPLEALSQYLGDHTLLVHGTFLNAAEREVIAASGAPLVTCPRSNARLGCGVLDIAAIDRSGALLALGTDSPASAGPIDMFAEMRSFIELQRGVHCSPSTPSTQRALELCTVDAAAAVGRGKDLGTIAAGCAADLVACRISAPQDPVSAYVLSGSPEAVQCVVVSGRAIWRNDMNRLTEARVAASDARALLALPVKL